MFRLSRVPVISASRSPPDSVNCVPSIRPKMPNWENCVALGKSRAGARDRALAWRRQAAPGRSPPAPFSLQPESGETVSSSQFAPRLQGRKGQAVSALRVTVIPSAALRLLQRVLDGSPQGPHSDVRVSVPGLLWRGVGLPGADLGPHWITIEHKELRDPRGPHGSHVSIDRTGDRRAEAHSPLPWHVCLC